MENEESKDVANDKPLPSESCFATEETQTNCYNKDTVELLSNGFVHLYKPPASTVQQQLKELLEKQTILYEQLHNENVNISWSLNNGQLQEIFNTIQIYNNKLLNVKKEMKSIHERSTKLKKRAMRLQQHKEKDMYIKAQQQKQEEGLFLQGNSSQP